MENESFERALEPQPIKRKRSSILKPAEKRVSRDSRTVSFSDRCIYKELHQDGTCDITNLFLRQDMDLTMMEVVEPVVDHHNQTFNSNMDISTEQASLTSNDISALDNNNITLTEEKMIDETKSQQQMPPASPPRGPSSSSPPSVPSPQSMDISLISRFMDHELTMPKVNSIDLPNVVNYDTSTIYEKKMSMASDVSGISSLNSTIVTESSPADTSFGDTTLIPLRDGTTMLDNCTLGRISDISSFNNATIADQSANETLFGAFHDSNNISIRSRASEVDTLVHNIEALNECIKQVDQEVDECRRRLDDEIEELFKFYRHIVSKDNKYEFAIRIFGLRHSLWLIIKISPDIYPNQKLKLKFAVNKRDRHLYPFPEFAEAVRRCTKEGRHGYLTKFVINAQKFRRFLRSIGYRKPNK